MTASDSTEALINSASRRIIFEILFELLIVKRSSSPFSF